MKEILFPLFLSGLLFITACGSGGPDSDADVFCSCVQRIKDGEDRSLFREAGDTLVAAFEKDPERYVIFHKEVLEKCPEAEEFTRRYNPGADSSNTK
jgi:hypothetical protein